MISEMSLKLGDEASRWTSRKAGEFMNGTTWGLKTSPGSIGAGRESVWVSVLLVSLRWSSSLVFFFYSSSPSRIFFFFFVSLDSYPALLAFKYFPLYGSSLGSSSPLPPNRLPSLVSLSFSSSLSFSPSINPHFSFLPFSFPLFSPFSPLPSPSVFLQHARMIDGTIRIARDKDIYAVA